MLNKRGIIFLIGFLFLVSCTKMDKNEPIKIIFDTDFGGDADDLGALAMLHNFHNRGECELLAVMLWNTEEYAVPAVDAVNRYYGNPGIPIGTRSRETHRTEWQHAKPIADALPNELTINDVPLAVNLYRKILAEQEDKSVVILTTGPLANIKNLIKSEPDDYSPLTGKELIEQKVKKFSIMGGQYPEGEWEWNFCGDMEGVTKFVIENLTVPIVFSGYELGVQIKTGPRLIEAGKDSPLYIGYKHFSKHAPWMNEYYREGEITPNSTYDQTSVLYAVRGGVGKYWEKIENGICVPDESGGNYWKEVDDEQTNHAYLVLLKTPEEMEDIIYSFMLDTFVTLSCQQKPDEDTMKVVVFTKTDGYRHESIPEAVQALERLCRVNDWEMVHTEDSLFFTKSNLKSIDVVVFLHTIGNMFADAQKQLIEDFVMDGGGLVTIHTGTVTENEWQWFSEAIGAKFTGHPPVQSGKLIIEDRSHPATKFFQDSVWIIEDEWYSFDRNPREDVHVLISIDESSYDVDDNRWFEGVNQRMGDHPLVWYKEVGKGTVFQTALGHPAELYSDSLFIKHLEGALIWSAGLR